MSFSGKFELVPQKRAAGMMLYSFVLKNTSWFGSDTFDCMICDELGQQPWYFRDKKLSAGKSFRFDFDTVGWTWYQHDYFAILGKNDKIVEKWQLNLKEYKPGECPDCHGTKKCKKCHGQGFLSPPNKPWEFKNCDACGGTGTCQRCDVPIREYRGGGGPTGLGSGF